MTSSFLMQLFLDFKILKIMLDGITKVKTPASQITQTHENVPDKSKWKTYLDQKYGYEILYPELETLEVTATENNSQDLSRFTINDLRHNKCYFSLQIEADLNLKTPLLEYNKISNLTENPYIQKTLQNGKYRQYGDISRGSITEVWSRSFTANAISVTYNIIIHSGHFITVTYSNCHESKLYENIFNSINFHPIIH